MRWLDDGDRIHAGLSARSLLTLAVGRDDNLPPAPLDALAAFLDADGLPEDGDAPDVCGIPPDLAHRVGWVGRLGIEHGGVHYDRRVQGYGAAPGPGWPRAVWRPDGTPLVELPSEAPWLATGPAGLWSAVRRGVRLVLGREPTPRDRTVVYGFLVLPLVAPPRLDPHSVAVPRRWEDHLSVALLHPRAAAALLGGEAASREDEPERWGDRVRQAVAAAPRGGFGGKLVGKYAAVFEPGVEGWAARWEARSGPDEHSSAIDVLLNEALSTARAHHAVVRRGHDPYATAEGRRAIVHQATDAAWARWREPVGIDAAYEHAFA
jgi:hypothetical protein